MACETGTFFCLVRDHASAMIRFPSPPVRGRMPSHGRMHALAAQSDSERPATDQEVAGSNPVRGISGPSPSGRASRPQREGRGFEPRRLHDMRHAAAWKRRHSEERRHVKTARPSWNTQTAASRRPRARRRGRPARERAGPISRGSWDRIPSPATRMWCSGSTPASQAGDRGFEPRHPLYPGALVFDVSIPRFRAGGPGDARAPGAGRQYAPYAPLVQRSEQRTFNPRATGPNPVGGTTPGRRPGVSAPIYQRIGCGRFPPAARETREGKHTVRRTREGPITQIP